LIEFLNAELGVRNWSMSHLARRSGVSTALMSDVLNSKVPASAKFCTKVARALKEPPERLLRMAGHLDPMPAETEETEEALSLFAALDRARRSGPTWLTEAP